MSIFRELQRRNVIKVAAAYVIVGWLLLQISDTLVPALHLPEWFHSGIALLLILGFPIAMIFAWAFELTPEGIKREHEVDRSQSITGRTGRKLDYTTIGLLVLALGYFSYDKFVLDPARDAELVKATTKAVSSEFAVEPEGTDKSIAVLPFANRSMEADNSQFFADGIHDDLLTLLANLGSMKVISRTSVMEYRDTTKNMKTIGEELGVATILEGGVQRAGNQVRINVQLINAGTDEHIWAKTYDRTLTAETLFAIQSEMAASIAEQLEAALSPEDQEILNKRPTQNLDAYNAYLMAGQFFARSGYSDLFQAESYYKNAIELDPDYAAAHTGLAQTYNQLVDTGAITLAEHKEKAGPIVERAIVLDDQSGEAWTALATYRYISHAEGVDEAFRKALTLSPNNSTVLKDYAEHMRKELRYAEAIPYIERGLAIDPLATDHLFELGRAYYYLARFDEALAAFEKMRVLDPTNPQGFYAASGVYYTLGELDKDIVLKHQAVDLDPDDYETIAHLAWAYLDLGDELTANKWLDRALEKGPDQALPLAVDAAFRMYEGEQAEAAMIARTALQNQVDNRWGAHNILLRVMRDDALRTGEYSEAIGWFRELMPHLFGEQIELTLADVQIAVNLALLLDRAGEPEQADRLLSTVNNFDDPTFGSYVYNDLRGLNYVHALAIAGKTNAAIDALRVAVDNQFRVRWKWHTRLNPNMDNLRDDPRYDEMITEIEGTMAEQLKELRDLQAQDGK